MKNQLINTAPPMVSDLISVSKFTDERDFYPFYQKCRKMHGMILAYEGEETYTFSDCVCKTKPGDVLYLPKNAVYTVTSEDEYTSVICFDFDAETPLSDTPILKERKNGELYRLFLAAETLWRQKKPGYRCECLSALYRIFAELQRQDNTAYIPSARRERIKEATEQLKNRFCDVDLKVEKLAEEYGMNPRYFARVFTNVYGVSPKRYLTALRMERARELILSDRYSVSQISELVGYNDIFHFSKAFKKEYKVSPIVYKNHQND